MTQSLIDRIGRAVLILLAGFSILLLVGPSLIVIAISFEPRGFIAFPPSGLSLRWYGEVFQNRQLMNALMTSLRVAGTVMLVCLLLGIPAAFTFIEAFDNVTVALFTSDVRARPLPVELYYLVQFESTPMIAAISALQIGLSLIVLIILARTIGLDRIGR